MLKVPSFILKTQHRLHQHPTLVHVGYLAPVPLTCRLVGSKGSLAWSGAEGWPCSAPQELQSGVFIIRSDDFFLQNLQLENLRHTPVPSPYSWEVEIKALYAQQENKSRTQMKQLLSRSWQQGWKTTNTEPIKMRPPPTPRRWDINQVQLYELGEEKGK